MAEPQKPSRQRLFDTRSHSWREAKLIDQVSPRAVKLARVQAFVFLPLFGGILVVFHYREQIFGVSPNSTGDTVVRIATVIALVILGWAAARNVGKAIGPMLFRRMEPGTAGTVGFLIRVATVVIVVLVALNIAGVSSRTLAVGGSITAIVIGLAAQQTLGNFFAGTVLLSARPFRVGDRVRLRGGSIGGQIEGTVSSLGLLYTNFSVGDETVMVPNSVVLGVAVQPLREPESVNLRARLRSGVTPGDLEAVLAESLETPLRDRPQITLEELDGDDVIVRIEATPRIAADGAQLANELLHAVAREARGEPGNGQEPGAA
jgi:small-conductance mechanosensitive channel